MWFTALTAAALCATAIAAPQTSHRVVHERRAFPPAGRGARVDPTAIVPVRIGLKQSNLDSGYARLMEVSHPSSERYGQHLSAAEVHELFAPSDETAAIVKEWLQLAGVASSDVVEYENKGWLAVDMPAWQAEQLLDTKYYEHHSTSGVRIGADDYSLPAHVSEHVDYIKPGVKMSPPLKKAIQKRDSWAHQPGRPAPPRILPEYLPHWTPPPAVYGLPPDLQHCGVNITPTCIQALYHIPRATLHDPKNKMGLFETYDAFAQQDLDLSFKHYAPWVPQGTTPKVLSVDGGTAPVAPQSVRNSGESDIDLFLAYSLIYPQSVVVYQVDDLPNSSGETNTTGFLNTFLDSVDGSYCNYTAYGITGDSPGIDAHYPDTKFPGGYRGQRECGKYELTQVLSISYGESEAELPKPYVERQCNEFMKLGLQGHSIFVASGDYGVASFPGSNNNTEGCLSAPGMNGTIYNPDYPCGCPYVTSVGATRLYPNQTVHDRESAMQVNLTAFNIQAGSGPTTTPYDFFATGGGFSNFFKPPSYQAGAVANYLSKYNPEVPYYIANSSGTNYGENGGLYNRAGRGYPDVSANGAYLLIYNNLTQLTFFGTSLASPIFASVVTLINEDRNAAGKGPVGFVNPTLYSHPEVLNDIVNGSNPNCGSCGFKTAPGWDPVTGLGTPNYPAMRNLFLGLP